MFMYITFMPRTSNRPQESLHTTTVAKQRKLNLDDLFYKDNDYSLCYMNR